MKLCNLKRISKKILVILAALTIVPTFAESQFNRLNVEIEFDTFLSGKVFCALYNNKKSFLNINKAIETTFTTIEKSKTAHCEFNRLVNAEYAVSVFYDANNNEKLDTNWIGIPQEPVGLSNNAKAKLGPPKFNDAKFIFEGETTITINMVIAE